MTVVQMIVLGLMAVVAGGPILQSVRDEQQAQPQQQERQAADKLQAYKRSYEKLFTTPQREPGKEVQFQLPPDALPTKTDKPRVVCGMVVVPVTPAADSKMVVHPKDATKPEYKMRVIEPRICNE
jgi:type II secretory pathway pseudopilin PulG